MGLFSMLQAKKQKKLDIKAEIMNEALSEVFTDCYYSLEEKIKAETVRDSGLIDEWNLDTDSYDMKKRFEYRGNDYFKGKYKGHEIECSDVDITKYFTVIDTDEDGNQEEREDFETSFKGIWMICKLEKSLGTMIRVREKEDTPIIFIKIVGKRKQVKSDVETENTSFNEQFQVLTDNPQKAFYVLTPHFMEHILSADNKANGRILLSFSNDKVHIAIHNRKDSFEIKKGSEIKEPELLKKRIQSELKYATDILDELLRNQNLF